MRLFNGHLSSPRRGLRGDGYAHHIAGACFATACGVLIAFFSVGVAPADDWPQWRGPTRDGVWRETGIVQTIPTDASGQIPRKWSLPIGAGYSQPTVADGRVYVTDRVHDEQELERVHCVDLRSGKRLWKVEYAAKYTIGYKAGPRAAVLIDKDASADKPRSRAFALGGVGHLHCLDAKSGKTLWKRDLATDYAIDMPRWGIAAAPLVEGDLLILHIGGKAKKDDKGSCVVALNKRTGKEVWRAIDDDASYVAPIIIDQAGQRVLIVYTANELFALDPKTGKQFDAYKLPGSKWPIGISTPVVSEAGGSRYLYTTNAHVGSSVQKLGEDKPGFDLARRQNDPRAINAMFSLIPTPFVRGGYVYGTHYRGELRCINLLTGELKWESTKAVKPNKWATIHIVAQGETGDRVWIFNEHGELIIAELSPRGYREISRGKLLATTRPGLPSRRGGVTWAHPAFANRHVIARNDSELVCASLAAE